MTGVRGRHKMIATSALRSRKLAGVTLETEAVYWRLHLACDNFGTMLADPWDVLTDAFPRKLGATEDVVVGAIQVLEQLGLVETWTEPDGRAWLHLTGFDSHNSAEFRRKRGHRRSPMPPSERPNGGEGAAKGRRNAGSPHPEPKAALTAPFVATPRSSSTDSPTASAPIDAPVPPHIAAIVEQRQELEAAEVFVPAHERIGAARAESSATGESGGGERLDDSGRDLAARAHPRRRPQTPAADTTSGRGVA